MEETQNIVTTVEQNIAQEAQIVEPTVEKAVEQAKPLVDKLYQLAIRNIAGSERMVTVIAEDVREAIAKVADTIAQEEHVFEAKFINEVHVK